MCAQLLVTSSVESTLALSLSIYLHSTLHVLPNNSNCAIIVSQSDVSDMEFIAYYSSDNSDSEGSLSLENTDDETLNSSLESDAVENWMIQDQDLEQGMPGFQLQPLLRDVRILSTDDFVPDIWWLFNNFQVPF